MTMTLPLVIDVKVNQERFYKFDQFGFGFCRLNDQQEMRDGSKIGDKRLILDQDETACWRLVHLKPEDKVYAIFIAQLKT